MSNLNIPRICNVNALIFSSLVGYGQIELKIEQSQYNKADSAAVFYCNYQKISKEIYRFDFDNFLFDNISWYYDEDSSLFYYSTKSLLAVCSSSGTTQVRFVFGCEALQCNGKSSRMFEVNLDVYRKSPNFKNIQIIGSELVLLLNEIEVKKVSLNEVSESLIYEFFK